MGKRLLAIAVVIASACTALHYTTTEQRSVTVADNPYYFLMGGTHRFTISPQLPDDDDVLQALYLNNCTSQWSIDTMVDPQGMPSGAEVCGAAAPTAVPNTGFCPRVYRFDVSFAGNVQGSSSCNVNITAKPVGGSGSGTLLQYYTVNMYGSGTGPTGITVLPPSIPFGDQQINTMSGSAQVTVRNVGSNLVTVMGTQSGSGFNVTPPVGSFGLGGGSSKVFDVICFPTAVGQYNGALGFTAGISSGSSSFTCNGIDSTVIIAPSQVTFANALVGRAPPTRFININGASGPSTATIQTVALDQPALDSGVTIVSPNIVGMMIGNGKQVELKYSAAAMHPAGLLGSLSIQVSADMNARSIAISGQALVGGVGTNPASVEFGAVCAGDTAMKDVEVYASEPGDVNLMSVAKPAAPFDAMAQVSLPKSLGGNHSGPSVTVRTTYKPTVAGDFKDMLRLTSDVPNTPDRDVEMHGLGLAEGIAATPNAVHFGTAAAGATTGIKEVQFTNCSTNDLMFNGVSLVGVNHGEFTLIGSYEPKLLHPTESQVFMIVMQPETSGLKTAALVINHDSGSTTVELDGTGEGGSNKDRETYYACSTRHGAGALPILLALLALRRRRR